ncbi:hypothetical protein ACPCXF_13375 [Lysinibacillus agricola]
MLIASYKTFKEWNGDYMKIFIFILITITTLSSWFKFRKEIKIAESNEEIRHAFVRFMLMLFLFLIFIVSVGFY